MSDSTLYNPSLKRILGDQRIFQSVFNDLKMKHVLETFADGTTRWVYTYEGTDPYELEDSAFPLTVSLISSYTKQARIAELENIREYIERDHDLETRYDYDYKIAESTIKTHNKAIEAQNSERMELRELIDSRLAALEQGDK